MKGSDFSELLKNFNDKQLNEINNFLNSAKGKQLKNNLSSSDKERLIREFSKLNPNLVQNAIKKMSADELSRIIRKL